MCGRTAITLSNHEILHCAPSTSHIIYSSNIDSKKLNYPQYNIGPYSYLPCIRNIINTKSCSDKTVVANIHDKKDMKHIKQEDEVIHDKSYDNYDNEPIKYDDKPDINTKQHNMLVCVSCECTHDDHRNVECNDEKQLHTITIHNINELINNNNNNQQQRVIQLMRWGLLPHYTHRDKLYEHGKPVLINARSETVTTKSMFKYCVENKRCAICVSGFYEWCDVYNKQTNKNEKHAYFVHMSLDNEQSDKLNDNNELIQPPLMYFAGIYEIWHDKTNTDSSKRRKSTNKTKQSNKRTHDDNDDLIEDIYTCSILTCEPTSELAWLHDRMPVILYEHEIDMWLNTEQYSYDDCVKKGIISPRTGLNWYRVNNCVGNIRNKTVKCLQPYSDSIIDNDNSHTLPLKQYIKHENIDNNTVKHEREHDNSPLKRIRLDTKLPEYESTTYNTDNKYTLSPTKKQKLISNKQKNDNTHQLSITSMFSSKVKKEQ